MPNPLPFPKAGGSQEEPKLSSAPAALLDLYALVQVLHEHGTLERLREIAEQGDEIIRRLASAASQPETLRAVRNAIEISKLLARFDPDDVQKSVQSAEQHLDAGELSQSEPPSLWAIVQRMKTPEARRSLALIAEALNAAGRRMGPEQSDGSFRAA